MKSLLNERVCHRKYGNGVIIEEELPHIKVEFSNYKQIKMFEAPFAFEHFLILEDKELQKVYYSLAVVERETWEKKKEQEIRQKEEDRLKVKMEEAAAKRRKTTGK